jgi:hypothetical protein
LALAENEFVGDTATQAGRPRVFPVFATEPAWFDDKCEALSRCDPISSADCTANSEEHQMDAILAAKLLFFLLGGLALIAPPRWALFSYLLLTQVDISAADFSSASSFGWDNAFRIVVIPTVLLLRSRSKAHIPAMPTGLSRWWLLFVADVAIASLWSPSRLSRWSAISTVTR